jgi:hypothetical protein
MSMKLLPASVSPVDPPEPDVSNSLVPVAQRAITVQGGPSSVVPSAGAFTRSSRSRRAAANWIDATPVDDPQSDEAASAVEYLPAWAWSDPIERTAIAHYLFYAAGFASGIGWLVNLYA